MSCLARLFTSSCRTSQRCRMDLILDQACCSKWQSCQLDNCSKTSRIRHVMRLSNLLTRTLAQAVNEISAGIIAVQAEIISKIDDPALRLDLMSVDKLTRNAMSQTKENHVRIVEFCPETKISLSDKVTVYLPHRSPFR